MAAETARLRLAQEQDLARIAEIHLRAYSRRHFTSRLPAKVLERYYGLFLNEGAETLLMVHGDEGANETIVGFAVFGRGIGAKIARFKRENLWAIMAASVRHPGVAAGKLARQLWNKATWGKPTACADHLLLSIAVARPGAGCGRALLEAFLARSAAQGAVRVGLYVNVDNIAAINSYVAQGFLFRELRGGQYYMERVLGHGPAA